MNRSEGVLVAALEPGHAAAEFEQVEVLGGGVPWEGSPPGSRDQPLYEIHPYSY